MVVKKKKKSIISIISSVIEWIICILLVLLIFVTLFQKYSKSGSFFGYRILTVASESMEPLYTVGDTLLVKDIPFEEYLLGDNLTYRGETSSIKGMIITHQITQIDIIDGKYQFHAKGIANNLEDPVVHEDQVLGKVVYKFYFLSILGKITSNFESLFLLITIPVAILVTIELVKVLSGKKQQEEEEEAEDEYYIDEDELNEYLKTLPEDLVKTMDLPTLKKKMIKEKSSE